MLEAAHQYSSEASQQYARCWLNRKSAGRWYVLPAQRSLHPVLSCCLCTARRLLFLALVPLLLKRSKVVRARRGQLIASRSDVLFLHCLWHLLFLALLPACDIPKVIMSLDCSAYAAEPLSTAGVPEAAHQYSSEAGLLSLRSGALEHGRAGGSSSVQFGSLPAVRTLLVK